MNKRNGGFIATSLIYSFFLVFIAIIAALLNNYIANKRILDRFNEDAEKELNMDTYNVTIIAKNASVKDGIVLTNMLSNSNFSNGTSFWTQNGNNSFTSQPGNEYIEKAANSSRSDNISQNIILKNGVQYYYSLEYQTSLDATYYVDIKKTNNATLSTLSFRESQTSFKRVSSDFKSSVDDLNASFSMGTSDRTVPTPTRYTHAMFINLTDAFGAGNEPVPAWIDRNISWFDGTIGLKSYKLSKGVNTIDVTFFPYENYNNYVIDCPNTYDDTSNVDYNSGVTEGKNFTFKNITSDLVCTVEWKI